ncbi:hypothetical protein JYU34_015255 [Plutella xylostella]|uniref:Uncharacterized protein n=1 Tax=Plutella xylostella TaxID=51655 RepID=A0ABQ7Q6P2_PLUXY|nr:hypothetical protein JYU34_015255 [Plutella xylostella]
MVPLEAGGSQRDPTDESQSANMDGGCGCGLPHAGSGGRTFDDCKIILSSRGHTPGPQDGTAERRVRTATNCPPTYHLPTIDWRREHEDVTVMEEPERHGFRNARGLLV